MKEAGSHWQSNPLAVYILCCTPPRDVQAHTNNGEDFPLSAPQKSISLSKLTPSKHQLATPSNKPVQSGEIEIRWLQSPFQIISQAARPSHGFSNCMQPTLWGQLDVRRTSLLIPMCPGSSSGLLWPSSSCSSRPAFRESWPCNRHRTVTRDHAGSLNIYR
jgi:hypothetical protein